MQMAWLHTPLEKLPGNPTRAFRIKAEGKPLPMPENPAPELVDIFLAVGPGMDSSGMGRVPVTAAELTAWSNGCRLHLSPWEFGTLLEMSQAFVQQERMSKDPDAPQPWNLAPAPEQRASIAKSVRSLLRD